MAVRDFPQWLRDQGFDSQGVQNLFSALFDRQNIDLQQELTSVASGDEIGIFDVSETGQVKFKKATVGSISTAIKSIAGLMAYADSRYTFGTFTRDLSVASGSQAITGVGFVPKAIIFGSGIASTGVAGACVGVGAPGFNYGFQFTDAASTPYFIATSFCIYIAPTASGSFQIAVVSSMDSDGFTVGWSKFGTPTGTATVWYLALR